jgi:hypothetical protein
MRNRLSPPRLALTVLRCFSHDPNYGAMAGDLEEEFEQRIVQSGIVAASAWYARDTARTVWALTLREIGLAPVQTAAVAIAAVLAINATTLACVLAFVRHSAFVPNARQWWTLVGLQGVTSALAAWFGCRVLPRREWPLALLYTAVSVVFALVGLIVVTQAATPDVITQMPRAYQSLALFGNGLRQAMFWLTCLVMALHRTGCRLNTRRATSLLLVALFSMCGTTLWAQEAVPSSWLGTWMLDVPHSTIGRSLMPGTPPGLTITGQTLALDQIAQQFRLTGETNYSDSSGTHSARETNRLSLDGTPTLVGPISLVFKRIDGSTFDILSELMLGNRQLSETSHFVVAADGRTLTETKTQTERASGLADVQPRTSISVVVFHKQSD